MSLSRNDIDNLRNRIAATKRHKNYNEANFVDVPIGDLQLLLETACEQMLSKRTQAKGMTPRQARRIIASRDAFIAEDRVEQYHQLYMLAKEMASDVYYPWTELEALAASDVGCLHSTLPPQKA